MVKYSSWWYREKTSQSLLFLVIKHVEYTGFTPEPRMAAKALGITFSHSSVKTEKKIVNSNLFIYLVQFVFLKTDLIR